jgi:hypothetical protein
MQLRRNLATSEDGFLFNPSTGDSFAANPVAADILRMLKEGRTADGIREALLAAYDVEADRLDRDMADFERQLREAGLLQG